MTSPFRARCPALLLLAMSFGLPSLSACGGAPLPTRPLPRLEALRRAARDAPDDPNAWHRLAFAEAAWPGGDPTSAREALQRALRLQPQDARLRWLAGLHAHAHGRHREALEHLLVALERAANPPGDPEAAAAALATLPMLRDLQSDAWRDALPRLRALLAPTFREALGDAFFALAMEAQRMALAHGDVEGASRAARAAGCVSRWRVAGPFGQRPMLDFLGTFPPDEHPDAPLRDRYQLSADFGERPTREVLAPDCDAELAGRWRRAGLWFAEGTLRISQGGPGRLRVVAPAPFSVWVDGRRVVRVEGWDTPPPEVNLFDLALEAGEHRVRLRLASRREAPSIQVAWRPGRTRHAELDPVEEPTLGTTLRLWREGGHRGRLHAQQWHQKLGGLGALAAWLEAMAWSRDPLAGRREATERQRDLLRGALAEDPGLWPAAAQEAEFLDREGRTLQALRRIEETLTLLPEHPALRARKALLLHRRGWREEAEREVEALARSHPHSLAVQRVRLRFARSGRRTAERLRAAEALVGLDASRDARFAALLAARRFEDASEELKRLETLDRGEHPLAFLRRRLEIAIASGAAEAEAQQLLAALQHPRPPPVEDVLQSIDLRTAREGGLSRAIELLRQAARKRSFDARGRHRLQERLRELGGAQDFERLRFAAHPVLEAYRRRLAASTLPEAFQDAPQVLVFDGTTERLYETGARIRITHQIYLLQSQQAVDAFGELRIPRGATLLRAATWKADGSSHEPDDIQGKESLSFPRLSPGDAVEFEYAEFLDPSPVYPRGASGQTFFFTDRETPFYHSELRLLAPPSQRLVFDERHGAPRRIEERSEDGLRTIRWIAREVPPAPREPGSPPPDRWLPRVRWAARPLPWPEVMATLHDRLLGTDVADARHRTLARRLAGEGSIEQRALRLAAWVREHVEPSDDSFGLTAPMVSDRRGHPARVLHYLSRLAGLPVRLVLASDVGRPDEEPSLPDTNHYRHLLVEYRLEDGSSWFLQGPRRHVPLRALPAVLLGRTARRLEPPYAILRLPTRPPAQVSASRVEATLRLASDGSGRLEATMRFDGEQGTQMRQLLSTYSREQAHEAFSRYLPRLWYPGAELREVTWEHLEEPERPLSLHIEMWIPSLGRRSGGRWLVPMPQSFAEPVAWTTLPSRRTPLLLPAARDDRLSLRILLPAGAEPLQIPATLRAETLPLTLAQAARRDGPHAIVLERTLLLRGGWLEPEDYEGTASRIRAVQERLRAARLVLQAPRHGQPAPPSTGR